MVTTISGFFLSVSQGIAGSDLDASTPAIDNQILRACNKKTMSSKKLVTEREPWLAASLSRELPGAGQIYAGRWAKGCILIILFSALILALEWSFASPASNAWTIELLVLGTVIYTGWAVYDAHKCVRQHNSRGFERRRKSTKDPWLAAFLSLLVPGTGHLYSGRWLWAVVFIIITGGWLYYGNNLFIGFLLPLLLFPGACCHAYLTSPVRRESSWKQIALVTAFSFVVLAALNCHSLFLRPHEHDVLDRSMEPAVKLNDTVLSEKYGKTLLKSGDLVVFRSLDDPSLERILRVTAVAQESVEIRKSRLYVDGVQLQGQPFGKIRYSSAGKYAVRGKPYKVPKNSVFLLGDNSKVSYDSRHFGAVPISNIVGIPYKILWPLGRSGPIGKAKLRISTSIANKIE